MPGKLLLEIDDAAGIYKIDVIDMLRLNNEPLRQRMRNRVWKFIAHSIGGKKARKTDLKSFCRKSISIFFR